MFTEEIKEKIKEAISIMKQIAKETKDVKEKYYYYGQIDGIIGLLDELGIYIDLTE